MTALPVHFISGKHPVRERGGFGHSVYVRAHALAASAAGYRPQIYAFDDREGDESEPYGDVRLLASRRAPRQAALPVLGPRLARAVAARALLDAGDATILVHGFGAWSYAGALAVRHLRRAGRRAALIATSYTTHVDESRQMLAGWRPHDGPARGLSLAAQYAWSRAAIAPLERRGYRAATVVTANYRCIARMLEARYGPLDVRIARYSSDAAFRERAPRPERPDGALPRVVSTSGHFERKGVDVLLRAYAALRDRGFAFRADVVGGGALLEKHRELARALGLDGTVTLHGVVPDVGPYLARADLYVLPSRSEQSGALSLIEALAYGLPAVASDCDGIPEDLSGSEAGALTPPGDAGALAAALGGLLADPAGRARRGAAARALFEARFSAGAFAADLGRIYREASARGLGMEDEN